MSIKLEEYAKNKVRSEMRIRGVTTETMCNLLNEKLGISLQKQSFNNKLCRSNLNSTFFFQCMISIGKNLMLSPTFPPIHTVRATFTAHGVPSKFI